MENRITESFSGDGGRDDGLYAVLVSRGWRSDRAGLPEEGDRFEWLPSTPRTRVTATADSHGGFGTTIFVETSEYVVHGPEVTDTPVQPCALSPTRDDLLQDIHHIETWR
jgi:hypothetical protein